MCVPLNKYMNTKINKTRTYFLLPNPEKLWGCLRLRITNSVYGK